MARNTAEQSQPISIFWLNKQGILDDDFKSGSINWTQRFSQEKSSIGYMLVKNSDMGDYIKHIVHKLIVGVWKKAIWTIKFAC